MILAIQKDSSIAHVQELKTEVHKIAGSPRSYGYPQVSHLCKALEQDLVKQLELAKTGKIDPDWLSSLDSFFSQMKWHFQITNGINRL